MAEYAATLRNTCASTKASLATNRKTSCRRGAVFAHRELCDAPIHIKQSFKRGSWGPEGVQTRSPVLSCKADANDGLGQEEISNGRQKKRRN